jgi:hypothetical protein
MARQIATSWEDRTSRRLRKKVEMLFAHLKRILKLDRDRTARAMSASWQQPPKTSEKWPSCSRYQTRNQLDSKRLKI